MSATKVIENRTMSVIRLVTEETSDDGTVQRVATFWLEGTMIGRVEGEAVAPEPAKEEKATVKDVKPIE